MGSSFNLKWQTGPITNPKSHSVSFWAEEDEAKMIAQAMKASEDIASFSVKLTKDVAAEEEVRF